MFEETTTEFGGGPASPLPYRHHFPFQQPAPPFHHQYCARMEAVRERLNCFYRAVAVVGIGLLALVLLMLLAMMVFGISPLSSSTPSSSPAVSELGDEDAKTGGTGMLEAGGIGDGILALASRQKSGRGGGGCGQRQTGCAQQQRPQQDDGGGGALQEDNGGLDSAEVSDIMGEEEDAKEDGSNSRHRGRRSAKSHKAEEEGNWVVVGEARARAHHKRDQQSVGMAQSLFILDFLKLSTDKLWF